MTTPRASWDLNLSDESDNEVENTANVNSEANAFANLFNGSGEKGKFLCSLILSIDIHLTCLYLRANDCY